MPAPARFRPVCTTPRKHRPKRDLPTLMVTVRDRLIREALKSPEYDDLTLDQIEQMVDHSPIYTTSGTVIPLDYPWWYGGLAKDRPTSPVTEAQREALAKARQKKQAIKDEIEKPYVKEPDPVSFCERSELRLDEAPEAGAKPEPVKEDEGPR